MGKNERITKKFCNKCQTLKTLTDFCRHKQTKDGFRFACKQCESEYRKGSSCVDCKTPIIKRSKRCVNCYKIYVKGENNPAWKGDGAGYAAIHYWVKSHRGKPTRCVVCNSLGGEKGCHWANLDHTYKRVLKDYVSLCQPCHQRWDFGNLPINLYEWRDSIESK